MYAVYDNPRSSGLQVEEGGMKFDLTALPAGAFINSAVLTVTTEMSQTFEVGEPPNLSIGGFAASTPTLTIPDFTAPTSFSASTGNLVADTPGPYPQTFHFDVTTLVRSGSADLAFILGGGGTIYIYGPGNGVYSPTLDITYNVPEPASILLSGLAGLMIAGHRRLIPPWRRS